MKSELKRLAIQRANAQHLLNEGLATCPFCGEKPKYAPAITSEQHEGEYWPETVICNKCGICFRSEHGINAVIKWNTRLG